MINLPWLFAVNIGKELKKLRYIGILTRHEIMIPIHRSGFHGSCHVRVVITAQVKENMASCVNKMGILGGWAPS